MGIFSQFRDGLLHIHSKNTRVRNKSVPEDIKNAIDLSRIPRHIGIIMDGNGRWAFARGLPRTAGHQEGMVRVREIVSECAGLGIQILTLYAFSTENWKRPQEEVSFLMNLFQVALQKEVDEMHKQRVRVRFIGEKNRLQPNLVALFKKMEKKTKENKGLNLNIAINYGSRSEILSAVRGLVEDVTKAKIERTAINEELFGTYLYTAGQPDPELIIRTSGEERLSNFLLWQAAYSEFVFVKTPWPEFNITELHKAIYEFQIRNRRFGAVEEEGGK